MKSPVQFLAVSVLLVTVGGCVHETGCGYYDSWHYSDTLDRKITFSRNKKFARRAWRACGHQYCQGGTDAHFRDGFVDGYADFLNLGGTGEPPLAPPPQYWNAKYRTRSGRERVQRYFNGFRAGAALAMQCGMDLRLVETSPVVEVGCPENCSGCSYCSYAKNGIISPEQSQKRTPPSPAPAIETDANPFRNDTGIVAAGTLEQQLPASSARGGLPHADVDRNVQRPSALPVQLAMPKTPALKTRLPEESAHGQFGQFVQKDEANVTRNEDVKEVNTKEVTTKEVGKNQLATKTSTATKAVAKDAVTKEAVTKSREAKEGLAEEAVANEGLANEVVAKEAATRAATARKVYPPRSPQAGQGPVVRTPKTPSSRQPSVTTSNELSKPAETFPVVALAAPAATKDNALRQPKSVASVDQTPGGSAELATQPPVQLVSGHRRHANTTKFRLKIVGRKYVPVISLVSAEQAEQVADSSPAAAFYETWSSATQPQDSARKDEKIRLASQDETKSY